MSPAFFFPWRLDESGATAEDKLIPEFKFFEDDVKQTSHLVRPHQKMLIDVGSDEEIFAKTVLETTLIDSNVNRKINAFYRF